MQELETAIGFCKGSSPGPDEIHYDMFKNLNFDGKIELLKLFNRIYEE